MEDTIHVYGMRIEFNVLLVRTVIRRRHDCPPWTVNNATLIPVGVRFRDECPSNVVYQREPTILSIM